MLWKVLCSTDDEWRNFSCAATRCSVRSATAASSNSLVALVALSESASTRLERRVWCIMMIARIRIRLMPTTSTASRMRPLDFDCADRCASRCRSSTCAFSKLASITSIAARPWACAIRAAMPAVSPAPFSRIMSALIAILRSTSVRVSSSSRVWAGLSPIAASNSENAGAIASFDRWNSVARFGSPISAKPRAALSARRINNRMSAIFFSTPTV